jgi:hypothetical protein
MVPTIGRIVLYTLTDQDAEAINRRRTTGRAIAERMAADPPAWPAGAQAHIGNTVHQGDQFPMVITRVWGHDASSAVNGTVLLDGSDTFWATSRVVDMTDAAKSPIAGMWRWPPRARSEDAMTQAQIKHMVDRFLSWRLPDDFDPDAGISFKAAYNEHTTFPMRHEPVGTNLLTAVQAEAMVRHMITDLP